MMEVDEAYTSKRCSRDGGIKEDPGGAAVIRDGTGFGMDRDVNGARGIFCGLSFVTKGVARLLVQAVWLRGPLPEAPLPMRLLLRGWAPLLQRISRAWGIPVPRVL